jgi:hypothetical protein
MWQQTESNQAMQVTISPSQSGQIQDLSCIYTKQNDE